MIDTTTLVDCRPDNIRVTHRESGRFIDIAITRGNNADRTHALARLAELIDSVMNPAPATD